MKFVREKAVKSVPASPDRFTGGVWQAEILAAIAQGGMRAHRFVYAPGGRSHWHTHEGEQAIIVIAGRGFVKRWDQDTIEAIGPGDWVHIEPGEKHWHGAAKDDILIHLAVTARGSTLWHEPVSDEDYLSM
jgi:quercetin dioxygenase-like cupin family protein